MPSVSSALIAALMTAGSFTPVLTLQDPAIDESSGLTRSAVHKNVLWTHNDGGTVADVIGVDERGRDVARVRLRGIDPYDPEALAPGRDPSGRPALFLGDLGDNLEKRANVSVFRFAEPRALGKTTVDATWFRFTYDDGPHDAEALLVDPRDGRLWVATKSFGQGGLYRAPRRLVAQSRGTNTLTRVADVPPLVTDGAFLPNGRFVLRTYTGGYLYDAPGRLRTEFALPIQEQGESVAVDGDRLLVGSEGVHSQVFAVALPTDATVPVATATPAARSERDEPGPWRPRTWLLAAAGAALLLLLSAAGLRRRRRS
ncbi:MAG: hypothetical protein ACXV3C_09570 [Actinomycetes bacterium]